MILGIDPGLRGAMCIKGRSQHLCLEPMPTIGDELHLAELARWLRFHASEIQHAYVEETHPFFKASKKSSMTLGRICGSIEGVLAGIGIPYTRVRPNVWTKAMHAGLGENMTAKQKSLLAASRMFPGESFRVTQDTPIHDGLVDAALIAEYGFRIYNGKKGGD